MSDSAEPASDGIAVVGMALRFPCASTPGEFRANLAAGVESRREFTDGELLASGVDPALLADPRYVKAGMTIDGIDFFDAAFFGLRPRIPEDSCGPGPKKLLKRSRNRFNSRRTSLDPSPRCRNSLPAV